MNPKTKALHKKKSVVKSHKKRDTYYMQRGKNRHSPASFDLDQALGI